VNIRTLQNALRQRLHRRAQRRGFVLLAVLVFVLLLSMIVASLLFQTAADESAANASAGSEQAWSAALSGVAELLRLAPQAGGPELDWQDNPQRLKHQLVYEDGADQWYFTAFTPAAPDSLAELRYGLDDAASRISLRQTTIDQLAKLPRVTLDLARTLRAATAPPTIASTDSAGSDGSDGSVGSDRSVVSPPIHTLEDLLQLPGITADLLLGEDLNRNGRLEASEDLNQDGNLDRGLAQYLTLDSFDPDLTREGRRRTRLNDPSDPLPAIDLPPAFTNYLEAVRASKTRIEHPADLLDATSKVKDAQGAEVAIPSGISKDELPLVLEHFTARSSDKPEPGLINLNTASAAVLATIPGIDESLAESIVSSRTSLSPDRRRTTAWLVQEGTVTPEAFKSIAPHLTARSHQFHCRVAGYGLPSGRFRVLEVHIDTSSGRPEVTHLRDVTRLGFPLILSESGDPSATSTPTGASIQYPRARNSMHTLIRISPPPPTGHHRPLTSPWPDPLYLLRSHVPNGFRRQSTFRYSPQDV
jgi:Helix-hairpin-helix motif